MPQWTSARALLFIGKDKSKSQPRLHRADGFKVDAKAGISNEAGLAGITLVHRRFARQFKHGNELLHAGQR